MFFFWYQPHFRVFQSTNLINPSRYRLVSRFAGTWQSASAFGFVEDIGAFTQAPALDSTWSSGSVGSSPSQCLRSSVISPRPTIGTTTTMTITTPMMIPPMLEWSPSIVLPLPLPFSHCKSLYTHKLSLSLSPLQTFILTRNRIIHFALFVIACYETNVRNKSYPQIIYVQAPPPPPPGMAMTPGMNHQSVAFPQGYQVPPSGYQPQTMYPPQPQYVTPQESTTTPEGPVTTPSPVHSSNRYA